MNNQMSIVSPDMLSAATGDLVKRIRYETDAAAAYNAIASAFAGKLLTKRYLPQLAAMFPSASRVYISGSYYGRITVEIQMGRNYYGDGTHNLSIMIADYRAEEKRRVDKAYMVKQFDIHRKEAAKSQKMLDRLPEMTAQYNALATAYAAIRDSLPYGLPYADYEAARSFRESA